jgi:hypothetical protein
MIAFSELVTELNLNKAKESFKSSIYHLNFSFLLFNIILPILAIFLIIVIFFKQDLIKNKIKTILDEKIRSGETQKLK